MFGIDTRSPAQLEQAQRQQQKEYVAGKLSTLGEQGTEIQRQVDLGLLTPAQAQQRVEAVKTTQATAERKTRQESLELNLQDAIANNASVDTITTLEKQLLALGTTSEEIRSAKSAGRTARNASETALASSLRQQLIEAVKNNDPEAVGRVAKTASDQLPTFEFQKELQAARNLKAEMAQLTTDERNTAFNQDVYNTLEVQIGENAAEAYKAKPDNSKAYSDLQKQADVVAKEGETKKEVITDKTVFNDVVSSNIRRSVGGADLSEKQLAKLEKVVFDGFDGLYAQAKGKFDVGQVDEIISTVLSDPEIANAIAEGSTEVSGGWFKDDKPLRNLINTKLRALTGDEAAKLKAAQDKLANLKAKQGK